MPEGRRCPVRELVLKRLAEEVQPSVLQTLKAEIEPLLDDSDMKVKKAALEILEKVGRKFWQPKVISKDE
jgi:hypothetical protein